MRIHPRTIRPPRVIGLLAAALLVFAAATAAEKLPAPVVFTQMSLAPNPAAGSEPRSRLMLLTPDGRVEPLTPGLYSARDPDVSFDGQHILFSAQEKPDGHWQVYEMDAGGQNQRRITSEPMDCRQPGYQSFFYVITADDPWHQITFAGSRPASAPNLFSTRMDGSELRQLTVNPYGVADPYLAPDGRILFSSRQSHRLESGSRDRSALFGVNLDGSDYAIYSGDEGEPWKRMPTETTDGLVVFVENDQRQDDGAGWLAAVTTRRNLHSHRRLSKPEAGLYHSPSPLPGGALLVSRRPADGSGNYGIYRFDPATGAAEIVHDDPAWHDIQARLVAPRSEPDGRSSVVNEQDPTGILYALNVFTTDLPNRDWMPPGSAHRLRVIEGMPRPEQPPAEPARRLLGEVPLHPDGSFNIRVPANIPIQLQLLDEHGLALRSCSWIWVKNKESRGCIGCHEDGELTPENRQVSAVMLPSTNLTLPPERRRRVSFAADVRPIFEQKCSNPACHAGAAPPRLSSFDDARRHVQRTARTSPLVWRLFGKIMARPWDGLQVMNPTMEAMPPPGSAPLTDDEKRVILEWIDMGAE